MICGYSLTAYDFENSNMHFMQNPLSKIKIIKIILYPYE